MAIELEQAEEMLSQMSAKKGGFTVTVSEFIKLNFQRLESSGFSRRTIYENLKRNGLELGSFKAFSECWRRNAKAFQEKLSRESDSPEASEMPNEGGREAVVPFRTQEERRTAKKMGQGLRPIRLPDGTEVEITETGAKTFKI